MILLSVICLSMEKFSSQYDSLFDIRELCCQAATTAVQYRHKQSHYIFILSDCTYTNLSHST